jgi:hypothetical protein
MVKMEVLMQQWNFQVGKVQQLVKPSKKAQ